MNRFANRVLFDLARKFKTSRVFYLPQKVQVEITNACNLRCIECPRTIADNLESGYLSFDGFRKIIEQFPHLNSISLFGNGESLLHPGFFEMVAYLRTSIRGIKIFLTTNGTLLHESTIDKLVDYHIHLTISLDAANGETFQKVAGGTNDCYQTILNGIKSLRKRAPNYTFTLTYMMLNENFAQAPEFVSLASSLGVRTVRLGEQQFFENRKHFHIQQKELYKQKLAEAIEIGKRNNVVVRHTKRDRLLWGDETKIEPCSFLWKSPFITWKGDWVLCCSRPFPWQFSFGNLFETDFRTLWFGKEARKVREGILKSDLRLVPFCRYCQHLTRNA